MSTYITHIYLDRAAKAALIARHTKGVTRQHHLEQLRQELMSALSRCEAGHSHEAEDLLVDLVENALLDSIDSWNANAGARAVVQALLNFGEGENHAQDT